jgi:hypothetical protein
VHLVNKENNARKEAIDYQAQGAFQPKFRSRIGKLFKMLGI